METFQDRLMLAIGTDTPHSFAKKCGFGDSVIRPYLKGAALPGMDKLVLMAKTANVNIAWLATGEGPMRPGEVSNPHAASTPAENTENFSMDEALGQTQFVLESDTVFRSALLSNIRAFHKSVVMEGEMQGFKEGMQLMMDRNDAKFKGMTEQMERMEQLLLSMGEQHEKKSQAA